MNQNNKKPKLKKDEKGWYVTDGWIRDAFFHINNRPSHKVILLVNEHFFKACK